METIIWTWGSSSRSGGSYTAQDSRCLRLPPRSWETKADSNSRMSMSYKYNKHKGKRKKVNFRCEDSKNLRNELLHACRKYSIIYFKLKHFEMLTGEI